MMCIRSFGITTIKIEGDSKREHDMPQDDLSSKVTHTAAAILEACKRIDNAIKPYLVDSDVRPDIAEDLLIILDKSDDLLGLVDPQMDSQDFLGVPLDARLILPPGEVQVKHNSHPDWDFEAWFGEKTSKMKGAAKSFIRQWSCKLEEIALKPGAPMTEREWLKYNLDDYLAELQHNAKAIFEETCYDRLMITRETRNRCSPSRPELS